MQNILVHLCVQNGLFLFAHLFFLSRSADNNGGRMALCLERSARHGGREVRSDDVAKLKRTGADLAQSRRNARARSEGAEGIGSLNKRVFMQKSYHTICRCQRRPNWRDSSTPTPTPQAPPPATTAQPNLTGEQLEIQALELELTVVKTALLFSVWYTL